MTNYIRDEESARDEIYSDDKLREIFGIDFASLEPCPENIVDVFCLHEPSLREQVREDTRYRQLLIKEIFNPVKFEKRTNLL